MSRPNICLNVFLVVLVCFVGSLCCPLVLAGETIYRSRDRINFVKIEKIKKDEKGGSLKHPYSFSPEKIQSVLRSIHFSKKDIFLNDIKNRQLLDEKVIKLLTPYIVEAFQKIGSDEVVVVSHFTKNPFVIIQNDRLTIFRAFIKEDGLHFRFSKIYAKLPIDRSAASNIRGIRGVEEAQGMGVRLEARKEQTLFSTNPVELVFDLAAYPMETFASPPFVFSTQELSTPLVADKAKSDNLSPREKAIRERLNSLESLKKDGFLTPDEYKIKREEILKGI